MARKKKPAKRPIENYTHGDKERANNPPVGLVTPDTDRDEGNQVYQYDSHLDPQLQWAGKADHTSFDVTTVSLHVHERIDPRTVIEAVKRKNGSEPQLSLFEESKQNPPLRQAIEFYKHKRNWSNRLVAGDSLLVMNSLLEKEGLGGQVQMIYLDPPYGIKYESNFQPFVDQRGVTDGNDADLSQEPEMIRAFRDTWELGIHSYLTYLRDRLLLARELLAESGSCFVQISDTNIHHVKELMEEVFGVANFCGIVTYKTTGGQSATLLSVSVDYLVWYSKDIEKARRKYRQLTRDKVPGEPGATQYSYVEPKDGSAEPRTITKEEYLNLQAFTKEYRILAHDTLYSQGAPSDPNERHFTWNGQKFTCPANTHWKPGVKSGGMQKLADARRLMLVGRTLRYKRYLSDNPVTEIDNVWNDTAISGFGRKKQYVVETNPKVIERCILMTTDPGDLVFDPTCGSGTTADMAEKWGRRWITCDTSRVSIALAKQRLMTANYPYFELARPDEGVGSGFQYEKVAHIRLGSIANNPEVREGMSTEQLFESIRKYSDRRTLYGQPLVSRSKFRVTGPFTVEAVPAPTVKPLDDVDPARRETADSAVARTGETLRHANWRDELLRTGIRGKSGQRLKFTRVEPLSATKWLHADADSDDSSGDRVVVSFGPEYAPIEQRQVSLAIEEAQTLVPKVTVIVFAAFQFDPEAAKDIDETNWPGVTLLKAQMNADLLTEDLKKKRASNESFWLIGQPDVDVKKVAKGEDAGKYRVSVHGFDYYNTKTGTIDSGTDDQIAMWMLDPDYDGRSLFPRQIFFPMSGPTDGWSKLAKNLKAEIDEELIDAYRGTVSLPFESGENKRAAVKIIDNRGIESLKIIGLE